MCKEQNLFEAILHELGVSAFATIVESGVRDLDSFLSMDLSALPRVAARTALEIGAAQSKLKKMLEPPATVCEAEACGAERVLNPVAPVHKREESVSLPRDTPVGTGRTCTLFEAAVATLSLRAQAVLRRRKVVDLRHLMSLTPKDIAAVPNAGPKTIGEIVRLQSQLAESSGAPGALVEATGSLAVKPPAIDQCSVVSRRLPRRSDVGGLNRPVVDCGESTLVGMPPEWSILSGAVPRLLGLEPDAVDALWAIASPRELHRTLRLSEPDWQALLPSALYREDESSILLALSVGYLLDLQVSDAFLSSAIAAVGLLLHVAEYPSADSLSIVASDEPILGDLDMHRVHAYHLDSFGVPDAVLARVHQMGWQTWGDICAISENSVIRTLGFCLESTRLIRDLWALRSRAGQADIQWLCGLQERTSFSSMIESVVSSLAVGRRESTILLGRLGMLEGHRWTLDDLGSRLGVTKERVRQIEKRRMRALALQLHSLEFTGFWLAVIETLRASGGVSLLSELAEQLTASLGWSDLPGHPVLAPVLRLGGYQIVGGNEEVVVMPGSRCLECKTVVTALDGLFSNDISERSSGDVLAYLGSHCSSLHCSGWVSRMAFSEGFLALAAAQTERVVVRDGVVYTREAWRARRGSRTQLVEEVLRAADRPMHFSEVHDKLRQLRPDDDGLSERNVQAWIANSASLLLWDRGTYIHRAAAAIPTDITLEVGRHLMAKLRAGVPFVSVSGVFASFRDRLVDAGVPSDYALYSCLRECRIAGLAYPRYPYAVLECSRHERLPVGVALEQFVLDSGGLVNVQDIKNYASDDLCISEQMAAFHVYNIPNVVRAGRGLFAHIQNLRLDRGRLAGVVSHAVALASSDGHVSVERVYADKEISCVTMGIDCPEMLYAVLQLQAGDDITLPGYPLVALEDHRHGDSGARGVIAEVAEYLARRQGPCSFDELERHFADGLGYNPGTVGNVTIRDDIVRYGRATVLHLDTIGWTEDKQRSIDQLAMSAIDQAQAAGRCYALASSLLESEGLPELGNGVVWTQTLLVELLTRGGHVRSIGNARNAIVSAREESGVDSFGDLCARILRDHYEGASELSAFEQHLRDAGIIQKRISAATLGDQQIVCVHGNVIMLRELSGNA